MTVEQQQQKDAYANRRIGQVKDRTEKDELLSSNYVIGLLLFSVLSAFTLGSFGTDLYLMQ